MYSCGPPHMAVQKQDDQHEHTFSNYVRIRDVVLKTCLRRWTIEKSGERGSGISVLPARHDDDDDYQMLPLRSEWTWERRQSRGIPHSHISMAGASQSDVLTPYLGHSFWDGEGVLPLCREVLHSHIHKYGHVRNRHVMFTTIEHRNLGIQKHVTTSCSGTKTFY